MYIDIRGMVLINNSLSVACTVNPWLFYYFIILILGRQHDFGYFWNRMFLCFLFFFFAIERGWVNERIYWFRVERRPVCSEIWGYFKKYPDCVDWALFVVKQTTITKYIFLIALFIRGLFQIGTKLDLQLVAIIGWP